MFSSCVPLPIQKVNGAVNTACCRIWSMWCSDICPPWGPHNEKVSGAAPLDSAN